MKNAYEIISTISFKHQYKPLSRHICYRRFMELLPPRIRQAVSFIYVRNDKLFIALSHPGYKMELNYSKDVLKSLLTPFREQNPDCDFMRASDVAVFHSKYAPVPDDEAARYASVPHYREAAKGEFPIPANSSHRLKERFEAIKRAISKNARVAHES